LADDNLANSGERLPVVFGQHRLRIKRIDMADTASHEQRDDRFRPRCKVRQLRCDRLYSISCQQSFLSQ
jgi:hypothetical protein